MSTNHINWLHTYIKHLYPWSSDLKLIASNIWWLTMFLLRIYHKRYCIRKISWPGLFRALLMTWVDNRCRVHLRIICLQNNSARKRLTVVLLISCYSLQMMTYLGHGVSNRRQLDYLFNSLFRPNQNKHRNATSLTLCERKSTLMDILVMHDIASIIIKYVMSSHT